MPDCLGKDCEIIEGRITDPVAQIVKGIDANGKPFSVDVSTALPGDRREYRRIFEAGLREQYNRNGTCPEGCKCVSTGQALTPWTDPPEPVEFEQEYFIFAEFFDSSGKFLPTAPPPRSIVGTAKLSIRKVRGLCQPTKDKSKKAQSFGFAGATPGQLLAFLDLSTVRPRATRLRAPRPARRRRAARAARRRG